MPGKLLLCVSANQTVAVHGNGGRIVHCATFANDEAGIAEFGEYASTLGAAHTWIAADTIEEDYRFESLPHTSGSDRSEMLARKLKQYYRNTPYVSAAARGRDASKRRDDRFLFSALTNPTLIDPWLRTASAQGLPIAGICLIPDLTPALLRALQVGAPNVLVTGRHHAGLRLTVYRQGEFCLSRLTRGDPAANGDTARFYAEEIANTRLYLSSLHPEVVDESLTAVFLDPYDSLVEVVQHVANENPGLACLRAGRAGLTSQLRIAPEHLDIALETIYLQLLAREAPAANLAPAAVTAAYRRHRTGRVIYAASAAVLLGGIITGGYNLWHAHDLRLETAEAARQTELSQTQYREITRRFPASPASSEHLRKTVEIHEKIVNTARTPDALLNIVTRALEPSPEISVQEIGWKHGAGRIEGTATSATTPTAAENTMRRQSAYIAGEIRPFNGNYRTAIESISRLSTRLAADPAVAQVQVIKQPLDVSPSLPLAGTTSEVAEQIGKAEFRLALTLKPGI